VALDSGIVTELAEKFYAWLRAPLESVSGGTGKARAPSQGHVEPMPEAPAANPPDTTPEAGCPTCHQAWGPMRTASGKRVCVGGHVERMG